MRRSASAAAKSAVTSFGGANRSACAASTAAAEPESTNGIDTHVALTRSIGSAAIFAPRSVRGDDMTVDSSASDKAGAAVAASSSTRLRSTIAYSFLTADTSTGVSHALPAKPLSHWHSHLSPSRSDARFRSEPCRLQWSTSVQRRYTDAAVGSSRP